MFYKSILANLFVLWLLVSCNSAPDRQTIKSQQVLTPSQLEEEVYRFNNAFQYDSSILLIKKYLENPTLQTTHKFYGYLYLSFTHKRLFDYHRAIVMLDSAAVYSSNQPPLVSQINYQKALAFFDIQDYKKADSLMLLLESGKYAYLKEEEKAKMNMQKAYFQYLNQNYTAADSIYKISLAILHQVSPCDQPMIQGKQIELYGAMNDSRQMLATFEEGMNNAEKCGIEKYKIYLLEMLGKVYHDKKEFKNAYFVKIQLDSLRNLYNEKDHRNSINELKSVFEKERAQNEIRQQKETIKTKNILLVLLGSLFFVAICGIFLYMLWTERKKIILEKNNNIRFGKNLISRVEIERQRLSSDLHDSISHDLLGLKAMIKSGDENAMNKTDSIIENLRNICRNLRPAMFEKVGLVNSLLEMKEEIERQHDIYINFEYNYQKSFDTETELQVFRIIQEAFNNIIKHANAQAARIKIEESPKQVDIEISDSGCGFDINKARLNTNSFGMSNMRKRAIYINGLLSVKSSANGTQIHLIVPKN